MKKTALTIGLFSLAIVATSFGNPILDTDGTGGQGTRGKKSDFHSTEVEFNKASNQMKSFASDSQLTRSQIKLD